MRVSTTNPFQLGPAKGRVALDAHILAFADDEREWHVESGRLQVAAPDTQERSAFEHLQAGRYHLVAITDVSPDDLFRPAGLRGLVSSSQAILVSDGILVRQDVVIGRRSPGDRRDARPHRAGST